MTELKQLADGLSICRVLNGMWQVSGTHGYIDPQKAIEQMVEYHNSGFTTWDLADIYGPAELFIGKFRKTLEKLKGPDELKNKILEIVEGYENNPDISVDWDYLQE